MKTALDRAQEMMCIPQGQLPIEALELAYYMCRDLGGCGEVFLTAYAIYAQVVEKYPEKDKGYHVSGFPTYVYLLHEIIRGEVPRIVKFKT